MLQRKIVKIKNCNENVLIESTHLLVTLCEIENWNINDGQKTHFQWKIWRRGKVNTGQLSKWSFHLKLIPSVRWKIISRKRRMKWNVSLGKMRRRKSPFRLAVGADKSKRFYIFHNNTKMTMEMFAFLFPVSQITRLFRMERWFTPWKCHQKLEKLLTSRSDTIQLKVWNGKWKWKEFIEKFSNEKNKKTTESIQIDCTNVSF